MLELISNIDLEILLFIQNNLRASILTPIFKVITNLGDFGSIWLLIIIVLILNKKTRKIGLYTLLGYVLCLLVTNGILKNVIGRTRPYDLYQEIIPLINKPIDFSFPSGHTAMAFTNAFILYALFDKRWGALAILIAILIGYSRLYLGVHFFSDVVGGILIGWIISKVITILYKKENNEKNLVM
ncbi:MAG: phosphatase PAP2 family protein [Coprobacillaceae bacterium]